MTPEQIDEAVALKLGWVKQIYRASLVYESPSGERSPEELIKWHAPNYLYSVSWCPRYSQSIDLALEIANVVGRFSLDKNGKEWRCEINNKSIGLSMGGGVAMAICLAFLGL